MVLWEIKWWADGEHRPRLEDAKEGKQPDALCELWILVLKRKKKKKTKHKNKKPAIKTILIQSNAFFVEVKVIREARDEEGD